MRAIRGAEMEPPSPQVPWLGHSEKYVSATNAFCIFIEVLSPSQRQKTSQVKGNLVACCKIWTRSRLETGRLRPRDVPRIAPSYYPPSPALVPCTPHLQTYHHQPLLPYVRPFSPRYGLHRYSEENFTAHRIIQALFIHFSQALSPLR